MSDHTPFGSQTTRIAAHSDHSDSVTRIVWQPTWIAAHSDHSPLGYGLQPTRITATLGLQPTRITAHSDRSPLGSQPLGSISSDRSLYSDHSPLGSQPAHSDRRFSAHFDRDCSPTRHWPLGLGSQPIRITAHSGSQPIIALRLAGSAGLELAPCSHCSRHLATRAFCQECVPVSCRA